MRFYNFLKEAGRQKTYQEKISDAQKKLTELKNKRSEINSSDSKNKSDRIKSIDLSIEVLINKIKLLQSQQVKREK